MKDIGDLLFVIVLAAIVWVVTAVVTMILSAAGQISIAVATVAAVGFVAFWMKGRSVSKEKNRTEAHHVVSDFEIVRSYGALFEDLDTSRYIYDKNLLPHTKERILSAAIRVLEREDSPGLIRTGAVLATELSQFQGGVGPRPLPTLTSVILDTSIDGTDGVEQHARAVASYTKSETEIKAERESEMIHSLVTNALRNAS